MARKPREKSGTGIYHVMLRGINKQDIFEDDEDYTLFRGLLFHMVYYKDEQGKLQEPRCIFYAYCIMTNHVHLLIRESAEDISTVIQRISVAYALYYNNKYQRAGHLFQNRFRSEPVNDMAYFVTLIRYIHQNPIAAGITTSVNAYKWSSWREYEMHDIDTKKICCVSHVLKHMPFNNLRDLVLELLPKATQLLDFDNESKRRTDDEVVAFMSDTFGLTRPTDLQHYGKDIRQDILRATKQYGASIRQLERLTGITFSLIRSA
jgi:REP element-mobilizing transposase RayT